MNRHKINSIKVVYHLIIIDESNSMNSILGDAISGLNETLSNCLKMQKAHKEIVQQITLISFNSEHFTYIYDFDNVEDLRIFTKRDFHPSGKTPLYDAIGDSISMLKSYKTSLDDDNVFVTIITDGKDDSSKVLSLDMVKNFIKEHEKL